MAHYLFKANYTPAGLQGLLKDGAAARVRAVSDLAASVGGRVEAMYFSFGDADVIVLAELPDNAAAAAISTRVAAAGAASLATTVLLTADEVDEARGRGVSYRPPGS